MKRPKVKLKWWHHATLNESEYKKLIQQSERLCKPTITPKQ